MSSRPVLPTFVVIGAMRSGSTSLYKHLQAHPQVFMPRKEIHFFDARWDRGLAWYRGRFEGYGGQPAIGEATPTYLADPIALDRLATVLPRARLVAVLRDPVERAYSHYWMEHARQRDPRSFEDAVADELAGRPGSRVSDYLARGRYVAQLDAVTSRFPRDQLHVLLLDDLRDRPVEAYGDVCRFLGVDDTYLPPRLDEHVNHFVAFRSMRVRALRRSVPDRLRLRRLVGRLNARADACNAPMDPATRDALRGELAADNEALARWLGRDLSAWGTSADAPS